MLSLTEIIVIIATKEAFDMWYSEHLNDDRKPQLWNKNDKVSVPTR